MKKVACFIRVSTLEQHSSVINQKEIFNNWIEKHNDCILYDFYEDEGISGTKAYKREKWLEMLEDGKNEEFNIILCKSFSRFGRNMTETLTAIKDLRKSNVRLVFIEDNLDSDKDAPKFGLFAWLAEQEAQKTSERIKTVWASYNQSGKIHACRPPYGYEYDKKIKNFVINTEESEVVQQIFMDYINGLGLPAIAKKLEAEGIKTQRGGNWGANTIRNIINNEMYTGTLVQNKTTKIDVTINKSKKIKQEDWLKHYNNHRPIVTQETYIKAQEELKNRGDFVKSARKHKLKHSSKNLFSNILFCANCGSTMTIKRKKSKQNYKPFYLCNRYSVYSLKSGHSSNAIWEDFLTEYVKEKLNELTNNKYALLKAKIRQINNKNTEKELKKQFISTEKELQKQAKLGNKLLELLIGGAITQQQFTAQNNTIANQIQIINVKKEEIEQKIKKQINSKNTELELRKGIESLLETDIVDWNNAMLRTVINKITVSEDNIIEIFYRYLD